MNKEMLGGLVCAACMLLLAFAAKYAHAYGYINSDTSLRVIAMNGLLIAWLGNRVPKKIAPNSCARRAMRVSGWSMVISGLLYTGLWAFAPIPVATVVGTGAIFASVIATLGYCFWLKTQRRTAA